jgi:hypothetical protein
MVLLSHDESTGYNYLTVIWGAGEGGCPLDKKEYVCGKGRGLAVRDWAGGI